MRIVGVLIVALLLLFSRVGFAQPASNTAIVPGKSIGPVELGMPLADAKRLIAVMTGTGAWPFPAHGQRMHAFRGSI